MGGAHRALPPPFGASVPAQRPEVCGLRLHSKTQAEVGAGKSQPVWSGGGWEGETKGHENHGVGYLLPGGNAFLAAQSYIRLPQSAL